MKNFLFPLILLKANDEEIINYVRATKLLMNHYTKTLNKKLSFLNIKILFSLKIIDVRTKNWLHNQYDEITRLAKDNNDIICSPFYQPKPTEKLDFLPKYKDKIFFEPSGLYNAKEVPSNIFQINSSSIGRLELIELFVSSKKFNSIIYLVSQEKKTPRIKSFLEKKFKKNFKTLEIDKYGNSVNKKENLYDNLKNVDSNTLFIIYSEIDRLKINEFSEKFLKFLTAKKKKIDMLLLGPRDHEIAKSNSSSNLNITFFSRKPPWNFFTVNKIMAEVIKDEKLFSYHVGDLTSQFDFYSMLVETIKNFNLSTSDDFFLKKLAKALRFYDGSYNLYVGDFINFAFKNNKNYLISSYLCKVPPSLKKYEEDKKRTVILYQKQPQFENGKYRLVDVHFCYLDIISISDVDIKKGQWSAQLNIEIISIIKNPIGLIKFENLSFVEPLFEIKKLKETNPDKDGYVTTIYYLNANFTFNPEAEYYPFDIQDLFIEYQIISKEKGILQPTPFEQVDKDFNLDGWKLLRPYSVVKRKKNLLKFGPNLEKKADLQNVSRIGYILKRFEPANLLKSFIPLFMLFSIGYYSIFMPAEEIYNALIFLITTFLAGIALYFSSDTPQPLKFSLIDKVFQFFYVFLSMNIFAVLSISLGLIYAKEILFLLKITEPLFSLIFFFYILKQKKKAEEKFRTAQTPFFTIV